MEKLNGKRVVVAGASGGIGSHLSKLLRQSGAEVFMTGRNAEKLAVAAANAGVPEDHCFVADISVEAEMALLGDKVVQVMGTPDILVNAAGVGIIKSIENLTLEDFNKSLQTNLVGTFLLVKTFLPGMKEVKKGLKIAHCSSVKCKIISSVS
jgi:NAD(P)-dependent dehydrogenase (short-subunit alcohol dehydrogenase family)